MNRSIISALEPLKVGDYLYLESSKEKMFLDMRAFNPTAKRKTEALKDRQFSTQVFTAVAAKGVGDVRILIRVERTV